MTLRELAVVSSAKITGNPAGRHRAPVRGAQPPSAAGRQVRVGESERHGAADPGGHRRALRGSALHHRAFAKTFGYEGASDMQELFKDEMLTQAAEPQVLPSASGSSRAGPAPPARLLPRM